MRSDSSPSRAAIAAALVALASGCGGAPDGGAASPASEADGPTAPVDKQRVSSSLSAAGIRFESGTDELVPSSGPSLDELAAAIGRGDEGPTAHVRVKIDPDPRACSGTSLAELRAQAIGKALVARGVPAKRVASVGLGRGPEGCTTVSASRSSVSIDLED